MFAVEYSAEIAAKICERLIEGRSLTKICRDPDMPAPSVVYRWLDAYPEFQAAYIHARELQADTLADEILAIADTREIETTEEVTRSDGTSEERRSDPIFHRRLRIEARMWYAGKIRPKKYGKTHGPVNLQDDNGLIRIEDSSEWPG